jgi:GWxTD domain-containing protein
MKSVFVTFLLILSIAGVSQPLRDINYNYLYDASLPFRFTMKPARTADGWWIYYNLEVNDNSQLNRYAIRWEKRQGIGQKEGEPFEQAYIGETNSPNSLQGKFQVIDVPESYLIVAFVIDTVMNVGRYYYTVLEQNYPSTTFLNNQDRVAEKYLSTGESVTPHDGSSWLVSYYDDNFPPAAPAFSEGLARVSKGMEADSMFTVTADGNATLTKKGLYLFQLDSAKAEGVAIRAEDDYPRYRLVKNLPGPFVYICTKVEYDRLEIASSDKRTFDRTVLNIAGDADRAKNLIKSYFRRVEIANQYFTSYKEGWKTDRGMVYIIFGLPDKVMKFYDTEVWEYDNDRFEVSFTFTKASSVFDPDNYVLVRDAKYKRVWYEEIDLWRKGLKFVDSN